MCFRCHPFLVPLFPPQGQQVCYFLGCFIFSSVCVSEVSYDKGRLCMWSLWFRSSLGVCDWSPQTYPSANSLTSVCSGLLACCLATAVVMESTFSRDNYVMAAAEEHVPVACGTCGVDMNGGGGSNHPNFSNPSSASVTSVICATSCGCLLAYPQLLVFCCKWRGRGEVVVSANL